MKMLFFEFRDSEREFFKKHELKDFEIEFIKEPLNDLYQLTEEQVSETDIISVFISSDVTENVIKKFKNLRIIATRSTGYNHIDIKYCSQNHIAVFNVNEYGKNSVAQYTFMLILALVRKLMPAYLSTKRNLIDYPFYEGHDLSGLSLGIFGCGSIGGSVAKIANFFGMTVYVCSYEKNNEIAEFAHYVTADEMLEKSDIITIHMPFKPETYHIINETAFKKMKNGVYIVNTSRGELLDIIALYNNILSEKIKGAALDVIECENMLTTENPMDPESSGCLTKALVIQKLLLRDDVILTPHIAYNTYESINTILECTFNNIRDFLKGLHTNQIRV